MGGEGQLHHHLTHPHTGRSFGCARPGTERPIMSEASANAFHPQLRRYVDALGGPRNFGKRHGLAHRTAERLYSGEKLCPPGLQAEIAASMGEGQ